ncbi:MAG: extracellular solute-binding protein [Ignavibacteriaceae bacterium]|nr:MAG: extracellular solute-binding protein [Chlorobiota bacterium]MBV6398927.1 hypothetical protein [Ignavibacteria bacterium]MCC6886234.1 extracellular solute-binding protein [Ignavibacteriales bacterium]MCE7952312.1 extracellular solute-binding protein [Chlorobi bacterium CHB7]MEB2328883.1 extracellular solute-binding protein [Ignavibacteriaceae bacterium]RIK48569.1 MAG: iron ABC transporter substrate-binding protein [Ignavibacteriota bacterium]
MKSHLQKVIYFLFPAIFFGCATDERRPVVVYSPHGKEMLTEFEQRFEAINPDIDIKWLDMGSQEIFERIRTERENPQADIWWGAPATIFMQAEKMDLLEIYKPSWADKISDNHKSKEGGWYGTFLTPEVIAYNTNFLTAETAPQDWSELINPIWKGKIVIRNPVASGTMRVIYCSIIAGAVTKTGSEEEGWNWLRSLDVNTVAYTADPAQMYLRLASADSPVTLWNMPDIILQSRMYNYPFGYIFPKSGTVVLTDGIALIKNSKNQEAAKKFYEFITTEESLILQAEKYFRIPARNDLDKSRLPEWIQDASFEEKEIDWQLLSDNESDWMRKWENEIKGKGSDALR